MDVVRHYQREMRVPNSFSVSMFDRFKDVVCDDWVREVVLFALSAAYSNKVVRFAGIDPERNVVRQSFAKRCFHGRDAALPRKLSGDSAARCPYRFHGSCLSNFLQRAQASSRAFLFTSFAFGISPSRMKPCPAPL